MQDFFIILFIALASFPFLYFLFQYGNKKQKRKRLLKQQFSESSKKILLEKVTFYQQLDDSEKQRFEKRIIEFLADTQIVGVDMDLSDTVLMLVAASAVIPVFQFQHWEYINLEEVLVYRDLINKYQLKENPKVNILGQVRPFQSGNLVLLNYKALVQGFEDPGTHNTGIHEFVHMVDKQDGDADGVPKSIIPKNLIEPWLAIVQNEIRKIEEGKSKIDPYASISEAEFLAVTAENFFSNPSRFQKQHPELYKILVKVFRIK
jgi:Mlc titration factor MtfA (ptsG expression regulator)